ncbi:hypothetical protein ACI2K4_15375 [Micromonospora sp. NPDC050397]|uniref:hypothetical protein n=1 Tax=Micromonospora sp. NPDC050397 TaxID=3364279 RepID=UPI00384A79AC
MTDDHLVECPDCDGTTFLLVTCRCTQLGTGILATNPTTQHHRPYADCQLCHGIGTVAQPCHELGLRRAQLVLTVVNVDTGASASTSIVPGTVAPTVDQDGTATLDLTQLVRDLARQVGAASVSDIVTPDRPFEELSVLLPAHWQPDLPAPTTAAERVGRPRADDPPARAPSSRPTGHRPARPDRLLRSPATTRRDHHPVPHGGDARHRRGLVRPRLLSRRHAAQARPRDIPHAKHPATNYGEEFGRL